MGIIIFKISFGKLYHWIYVRKHDLFDVMNYDVGDRVVHSLLQLSEMALSYLVCWQDEL